jgi:hypothetical protein
MNKQRRVVVFFWQHVILSTDISLKIISFTVSLAVWLNTFYGGMLCTGFLADYIMSVDEVTLYTLNQ